MRERRRNDGGDEGDDDGVWVCVRMQLPGNFMANVSKYAEEDAVVFQVCAMLQCLLAPLASLASRAAKGAGEG